MPIWIKGSVYEYTAALRAVVLHFTPVKDRHLFQWQAKILQLNTTDSTYDHIMLSILYYFAWTFTLRRYPLET